MHIRRRKFWLVPHQNYFFYYLSFHQDLETNADSPVTSMMSDHGTSSTFVAGFADGEVKVFDRRMEEENAVVRSYSDHESWVQNVRWHPALPGQFLSAR